MKPVATFAVLAITLATAACGGHHDDATSGAPAGTPLSIDTAAQLRVGVVRGDTAQEFQRVVTPFLLPDGRLVVPAAGARAIRVFGPDGVLRETLGRPGEGPGEFGQLNAAWARGDTIEAFDGDLGRVTRFLPGGEPVVVPLDMVPSAQMGVPGVVAGGWIVTGVAGAGFGRRDSMVVHRFTRAGAHAVVIASVEGMARYRTPTMSGPDPLSPRAVFALHGDAVYVAETLTPAIRVLAPDGALERTVAWQPDAEPAPRAAFEEVVDAVAAQAGPERAAGIRRQMASYPVRDRVPAFWDFMVDDDGFVWVQPFDAHATAIPLAGLRGAAPGGRWLILSPDGTRVGTVRMPDRFQPTQITADAVVGIRRNALGVEFVEVHALERR